MLLSLQTRGMLQYTGATPIRSVIAGRQATPSLKNSYRAYKQTTVAVGRLPQCCTQNAEHFLKDLNTTTMGFYICLHGW
jgi:hypothetical protein